MPDADETQANERVPKEEIMLNRRTLMLACATLALSGAWSIQYARAADPDAALEALKTQVYSLGPNGEKPTAAASVSLTDEELAKIKAMKAKAAFVFHYSGNDWSNAQEAALKEQFAAMGIEVIATPMPASSRRSRSPISRP